MERRQAKGAEWVQGDGKGAEGLSSGGRRAGRGGKGCDVRGLQREGNGSRQGCDQREGKGPQGLRSEGKEVGRGGGGNGAQGLEGVTGSEPQGSGRAVEWWEAGQEGVGRAAT